MESIIENCMYLIFILVLSIFIFVTCANELYLLYGEVFTKYNHLLKFHTWVAYKTNYFFKVIIFRSVRLCIPLTLIIFFRTFNFSILGTWFIIIRLNYHLCLKDGIDSKHYLFYITLCIWCKIKLFGEVIKK